MFEAQEATKEGWRVGLEGWAGGLEGWRAGGLEGWRVEGLEGWRVGGLEGWRAGRLEDPLSQSLAPTFKHPDLNTCFILPRWAPAFRRPPYI